VTYSDASVSPVCAIVGGVVAQEILKTICHNDKPFNNSFFFNGLDDSGKFRFCVLYFISLDFVSFHLLILLGLVAGLFEVKPEPVVSKPCAVISFEDENLVQKKTEFIDID
jgi:hypothetical protein